MIPRFTLDVEPGKTNETDPEYAYFLAEIARLLMFDPTCTRIDALPLQPNLTDYATGQLMIHGHALADTQQNRKWREAEFKCSYF